MRRQSWTTAYALLILLVAAALPLGSAAAASPEASATCGACHRDIYRMWSDSAHAKAFEDPFFLLPLAEVRDKYGEDRTNQCIRCHAPMAEVINDFSVEKAITREGVNCEFCHGLVDVELEEGGPRHRLDIGTVKRGTIPGADSRGHDVAFSELHMSSLICAPCHEYSTAAGTQIMTTYSEWSASSSAEGGETCQTCHMSLVKSDVVDPRIKRETGAQVNLHEMPGGHSIQQLTKALKVRLTPGRSSQGLEVKAQVRNAGAGHAVPTGMPGRRILLRVSVRTSEGKTLTDERVYERSYANGDGQRVDHVADLFFADGLHVREDTRLSADETREERFVFPLPENVTAWVDLTLRYEYSPWGEEGERVSFTIFSENRLVRRSP